MKLSLNARARIVAEEYLKQLYTKLSEKIYNLIL
jgi:hypothetical protein